MNSRLHHYFEVIADKIEQFIECTGRSISWLVLIMVLVTFSVVILRYVFDAGWIALQESISYFHSIVFLLGAAYTLKHNAHVRVDIFYTRLSKKAKAWVDLTGHILILMPVMIFIIWVSTPYILDSWQVTESSREAGGLPGVYLLKSLILVMAGLLILQGLAMILKAVLTISGHIDSQSSQNPLKVDTH